MNKVRPLIERLVACLVALGVTVLASSSAWAQGGAGHMRLSRATVAPGEQFEVTLSLEADRAIEGLAVSIDFNETVLTATGIERVWELPNHEEWVFFNSYIDTSDRTPGSGGIDEGYLVVITVFSFDGLRIPAGQETETLAFGFQVKPAATTGETVLNFIDGGVIPGESDIDNVLSTEGASAVVEFEPGIVTIEGPPVEPPDTPAPRHFTIAGLGEFAARIDTGEDHFVSAVAAAGDFDEDGRSDVLLRLAPRDLAAVSQDLVVLLYGGAAAGEGTIDLLDRRTRTSVMRTGHMPAGQGGMAGGEDVNGDGRPDLLLVSGPSLEFGAPVVVLVFGNGRSLPRELDVTSVGVDIVGTTVTDRNPRDAAATMGVVSALSPDMNGDGLGEVVIAETAGRFDRRRCFVLFGSTRLPEIIDLRDIGASAPGFVLELDSTLGEAGIQSVSSAGDIDGDGRVETGITTFARDGTRTAWLLFGRAQFREVVHLDMEEFPGDAGIVLPGYDELARGGDVDGDGFGDAVLSQIAGDGEADVLYGRPREALPGTIDRAVFRGEALGTIVQEPRSNLGFGTGVPRIHLSDGRDLDGDGRHDVLLGTPGRSISYGGYTFRNAGAVFLLPGGDDLPERLRADEIAHGVGVRLDGSVGEGQLGGRVVSLSDFDGDGTGDILLTSRLDPCAVDPVLESDELEVRIVSGQVLLEPEPAPRLGGVVPRLGSIQGDERVVLFGRGFEDTTRVRFGDAMAEVDDVVGSGILIVRSPPGDLPVDVPVRLETHRGSFEGDVRYGYVKSRELSVARDSAAARRLTLRHTDGDFRLIGLAVGDFDGDSRSDAALLDLGGGEPHLHLVFGQGRRSDDVDLDALAAPQGVTITIPRDVFSVQARQLNGGGDLNADGFDDLVLGLTVRADRTDEHLVILGRPDFPDGADLQALPATIRITHPDARAEAAAAIVPDVSGDGVDELLLAARTDTARLYVIQGGSDLPAEFALEEALVDDGRTAVYRSRFIDDKPERGPELRFLDIAGAAGDFNGDGIQDVFFAGDGRFAEGAVAILYGGPAMFSGRPIDLDQNAFGDALGLLVTANSLLTGFTFGAAVPGDLDGDGDPELLYRYDNMYSCLPTPRSGGAFLVDREAMLRHGFPGEKLPVVAEQYGRLSTFPDFTPLPGSALGQEGVLELRSGLPAEGLAIATSPAGDFNGDGIDDVLIGTGREQDGLGTEKAYVVFGEPGLLSRSLIDLVDAGETTLTLSGPGVRGFGNYARGGFDWDGDGVSDIIIGADVARADIIFGEPLLESSFIRGDADGDTATNIADVIFGLSYLFSGGARPLCLDALDVDDDGRIRVNDAIYLLSFLFEAGPPPKAPYPDPGSDPTPDALRCTR